MPEIENEKESEREREGDHPCPLTQRKQRAGRTSGVDLVLLLICCMFVLGTQTVGSTPWQCCLCSVTWVWGALTRRGRGHSPAFYPAGAGERKRERGMGGRARGGGGLKTGAGRSSTSYPCERSYRLNTVSKWGRGNNKDAPESMGIPSGRGA